MSEQEGSTDVLSNKLDREAAVGGSALGVREQRRKKAQLSNSSRPTTTPHPVGSLIGCECGGKVA